MPLNFLWSFETQIGSWSFKFFTPISLKSLHFQNRQLIQNSGYLFMTKLTFSSVDKFSHQLEITRSLNYLIKPNRGIVYL